MTQILLFLLSTENNILLGIARAKDTLFLEKKN